ncbi:MAG: hypothetical protein LASZOEIN_000961 [Candidatus Fervidibacter sp.]
MRDLSALLSARTNYPGEQTEQRAQNEILQRQPLSVAKRCQISQIFFCPALSTWHILALMHACMPARFHAYRLKPVAWVT